MSNNRKDNFKEYHIVRLPSLIGFDITKNMLYDIKHNTPWIDKIVKKIVIFILFLNGIRPL